MKRKTSDWYKAVKTEQLKRDWSNQDLADAVGLTRNYVCAVVRGRIVSPGTAEKISRVLGIPAPDESVT